MKCNEYREIESSFVLSKCASIGAASHRAIDKSCKTVTFLLQDKIKLFTNLEFYWFETQMSKHKVRILSGQIIYILQQVILW